MGRARRYYDAQMKLAAVLELLKGQTQPVPIRVARLSRL